MSVDSGTPLAFGPLGGKGVQIKRSGIHWIRTDGYVCRPNEVFAYCNIGVESRAMLRQAAPFAQERALQVAFASHTGGRLHIPKDLSTGGYLDVLSIYAWDAAETLAYVETLTSGETSNRGNIARLLMLAGRRMGWAVDIDVGLLPGWHSHARGWWGDDPSMPTLTCMGVCDASGAVRGDNAGFAELFEITDFAAHFVHISEHPVAPCATIMLEQLMRTPAQQVAIAADLQKAFATGTATSEDWIFFGALSTQLGGSPLRERYELLTDRGIELSQPSRAALISLNAEPRTLLRHRTLGYHLNILEHNMRAAGPVARAWLGSAFTTVGRSLRDIKSDYVGLFSTAKAELGARFLILNRMSTFGGEDIASYRSFDAPMGEMLSSIAAKECNLMLDEFALEHNVAVIDVDAIGSDIGGREHLPDGLHHSALMQARIRAEVLESLV